MPKAEADIRASLDAVIDDVEKNQRIYGWFAGNVGDLARATRQLVGTVEHRFDQVDQRFEQVDQRFEQVDQRFDAVDRRFDQVDKRFDKVEKQLGLVVDEVRVTGARVEELVKYIVRDELKGEPDAT